MRALPIVLFAACLTPSIALAQGQRITGQTDALVRAIFSPTQRWLILIVDRVDPVRKSPDGQVDATYTFFDLSGAWPHGERWEGRTVLEDYSVSGEGMNQGVGLKMDSGLVQVLAADARPSSEGVSFQNPSAAFVLKYRGSDRGSGGTHTFSEAEETAVANATRKAPPPAAQPPVQAPVRVGGNIRMPRRIQDAAPVVPEIARQAGIRGVVILEIIIGTDGAVTGATILRSIPLLDPAALETVRQWRYEPTLLNGVPVRVILTATVNFQ